MLVKVQQSRIECKIKVGESEINEIDKIEYEMLYTSCLKRHHLHKRVPFFFMQM